MNTHTHAHTHAMQDIFFILWFYERFAFRNASCLTFDGLMRFLHWSPCALIQLWDKWFWNYFPAWNCVHWMETTAIISKPSVLHDRKWLEIGSKHFSQCNINLALICYIDFCINWSIIEDCVAVGRGVDLLDWLDTTPAVEVLAPVAPPPSLARPLVSQSSASFTVGCTVRICRCRLCVEPALNEILFRQILHCALTLSTSLKLFQMLLCFRLIFLRLFCCFPLLLVCRQLLCVRTCVRACVIRVWGRVDSALPHAV